MRNSSHKAILQIFSFCSSKRFGQEIRVDYYNVYGPNDSRLRESFWRESDSIHSRWNGPWCLGGDWNVIRFPSEKSGGVLLSAEMEAFLDWINTHSLIDLNLRGILFTWSNHQNPTFISHLDRVLVSGDWPQVFPEVCLIALPKPISDHWPIKLNFNCKRWPPSPFRFEIMWLEGNN